MLPLLARATRGAKNAQMSSLMHCPTSVTHTGYRSRPGAAGPPSAVWTPASSSSAASWWANWSRLCRSLKYCSFRTSLGVRPLPLPLPAEFVEIWCQELNPESYTTWLLCMRTEKGTNLVLCLLTLPGGFHVLCAVHTTRPSRYSCSEGLQGLQRIWFSASAYMCVDDVEPRPHRKESRQAKSVKFNTVSA